MQRKRFAAAVMSAVILAGQLCGCGAAGKETTATESNGAQQAVLSQLIQEGASWLLQNQETIRQYLLSGDYSKAAALLEQAPSELQNDAVYNALLYIAYVANAQSANASALLENKKLDYSAFDSAVDALMEELKENPGLAAKAQEAIEAATEPT